MKTSTKLNLVAVACATLLAACGGGGGDSAPVPGGGGGSPTATTTVCVGTTLMQNWSNGTQTVVRVDDPSCVVPGNLVTTMPTNPYLAGSVDARTFTLINTLRIAGGFGAAVEDPVMRLAADNHLTYNLANANTNDPAGPHGETVGRTGFTGATPQDRCAFAAKGTDGDGLMICGENGVGDGALSTTIDNFDLLGTYTTATGHLQNLLDYRNNRIGIVLKAEPAPATSGVGGVMVVGARVGKNATLDSDKARSIVGVFPYDGMTDVRTGVNVYQRPASSTIGSMSILVQSSDGSNPVVTSFTLRKDGATSDTPTQMHVAGTPHGTEPTMPGWAILFPTVVLDKNTKYTVSFKGSIGGTAVEKVWSFTTGTREGAGSVL